MIPPRVPAGFRIFYTTIDFDGGIDDRLAGFVHPAVLATCKQVHGAAVWGAAAPGGDGPPPECDALWTGVKGVALAVRTADCLAVSLIDPRHHVIANVHCGWRGAVKGVTVAALDAAPLDPQSSFAYLGPSIRVCCFEVGEEVAAQFDPRFLDRTRGPKPHVDLAALTVAVLRERGFSEEGIVDTGMCTKCGAGVPGQLLFHSYRRDRRSGSNLAIVVQ